jgi:hypothetical protein
MSVWSSIGGAVCVAVTLVGLTISWFTWRKKGAVSGMRAVAWSLLPLAAYLTHAVLLLGRIVNAVVRFAGSFVFSPEAWAGVAVVGLSALLFLASGGLPLLNWRKARARRKQARAAAKGGAAGPDATAGTAVRGSQPAAIDKRKAAVPSGAGDDDMNDIEEILRRRGIK